MSPEEQHERYEAALRSWSDRINLIGPEAKRHLRAHIDEAREAGDRLRPTGKCLDFGSGGGLPAIPIVIDHPESQFTLVEADQKKWAFLKHVGRECALNLRVLGDRLEDLLDRDELDGPFRFITSRAVGYPERWLPLISPSLEPDARVALFEHTSEPPKVGGFETEDVMPLSRGNENYLIILRKSIVTR